jgi:hypothetical protein
MSWDNSVITVIGWGMDDRCSIPDRQGYLHSVTPSRSPLGPTQFLPIGYRVPI